MLSIALAAVTTLLLGCGTSTSASARSPYEILQKEEPGEVSGTLPDVTEDEWTLARDRLARLRRGRPDKPYVERVRLAISDPRTGRQYQARGAVAVSPGKAARMILVGPGGTTALDVWVTRDRFRFAVPAIKLEKRGGVDPAEAKGLPIGMLRWWFLSPLAGRLLIARSTQAESAWILRDGVATVTVRTDGRRFVALRREGESLEGIEWFSRGLVPQSGEHGRYIEGRFGLRVEVVVEELLEAEPDADAFADPDEPGTAL
ncbi:MAG: hypothetical protein NVS3B10_30390 [Polyangiales bacterium]